MRYWRHSPNVVRHRDFFFLISIDRSPNAFDHSLLTLEVTFFWRVCFLKHVYLALLGESEQRRRGLQLHPRDHVPLRAHAHGPGRAGRGTGLAEQAHRRLHRGGERGGLCDPRKHACLGV